MIPTEREFNLRKFDMRTMGKGKISLFVARRGMGKSTVLMDALWHYRKKHDSAMAISPTEESTEQLGECIAPSFIYTEYDDCPALARAVAFGKKEAKTRKRLGPSYDMRNMLVVLEDCTYHKGLKRDQELRRILMNGRHWGITLLMTMQYAMDLGPDMRTQFDYVFVLMEKSRQNRKRLYDNWFGVVPTFDMFDQMMNMCTQNYGCLVLDNTSRSSRIEDNVFWYRAKQHPKFRIGSRDYWLYHHVHKKTRREEEEEASANRKTADLLRGKKKQVTVRCLGRKKPARKKPKARVRRKRKK